MTGVAFTTRGTSYGILVLATSVFECTSGAYVGLTSVILVDLLGIEVLDERVRAGAALNGIASLIGQSIGGETRLNMWPQMKLKVRLMTLKMRLCVFLCCV